MYLEVLAFMSVIPLILIVMAEYRPDTNRVLGFVGSIIFILIGTILLSTTIDVHTGDLTNSKTTSNSISSINGTIMDTNSTRMDNTTFVYTPISFTQFNFNQTLGIIIALLGLIGCFKYTWVWDAGVDT